MSTSPIDWLLSVWWYGGFLAIAIGLFALVRPIRRVRLTSRRRAAAFVLVAVMAIVANGLVLPRPIIGATTASAIDDFAPVYHFAERHTRSIDAPADEVMTGVKSVTAGDIALFETFTAIRRFGRSGPESILNAPEHQPILTVATKSGFIPLADTGREIVVGTIVVAPPGYRATVKVLDAQWFKEASNPGLVKATMNFRVDAENGARTRLTTETRVFATDEAALRRFTPYWRTIFPGSWILRVTWLDAIAKRTHRQASVPAA
jgi:hypothetical protein